MRAIHGPTMGGAWVLTAVLVATACHNEPRPKSPGLERQLNQMAITAERDSLLLEVAANGRLLTDIQSELSKVKPKAGAPADGVESPALEVTKDQRTYVLDRVKEITARIKEAETRLASSERRVSRLTQGNDSLKTSLAGLTAVLSQQQATIESLNTQVDGLTTENLVLADSVLHLTDAHNTVYFVAGTRKELVAKGVLVADGPRVIPLIGKRNVQPARELPLSEFTSLDRTSTQAIALPRADRRYRIVSRQNPAYVADAGRDGEVRESFTIAAPEKFWEPSRYLILVQQ
jgi:hypothetical protein